MNLVNNNLSANNANDLMKMLQLPPDQLAQLTSSMEKNILNGVLINPSFLSKIYLFLSTGASLSFYHFHHPLFFDESFIPKFNAKILP